MKLKRLYLACALSLASAGFADAGGVVLFGENGLVEDRSAALAELVPWNAPDAALRLADVKAMRLGVNPRGMNCTLWIRNLAMLRNNGKQQKEGTGANEN